MKTPKPGIRASERKDRAAAAGGFDVQQLIRPLVQRLQPYVPGEQPKIKGLIKLNTNENPYPPAAGVLEAVRAAVDGRLRLYPNPTADPLREKLAKLHGCGIENIIVGNGSDELLALAVRAFVDPIKAVGGNTNRPRRGQERSLVQFFQPSYSLYPVLAEMHGAIANALPLEPDFGLPSLGQLRRGRNWSARAALTLVTTPNAPSGRGYATSELDTFCRAQNRGVVVLDEAYVDFADQNAMDLALKHPQVLVARTFSKAYSLCFQRVGYMVGHQDLIGALQKIRDSYNVNGLGQIAAAATLDHLPAYRANFRKVIDSRQQLSAALTRLGFRVLPSQTNFIFTRPPVFAASEWLVKLRERKILVRWFSDPVVSRFLRITVGTPEQNDALLKAATVLLR